MNTFTHTHTQHLELEERRRKKLLNLVSKQPSTLLAIYFSIFVVLSYRNFP